MHVLERYDNCVSSCDSEGQNFGQLSERATPAGDLALLTGHAPVTNDTSSIAMSLLSVGPLTASNMIYALILDISTVASCQRF